MSAGLHARIDELEEEVRQLKEAFAPKIAFPLSWQLEQRESVILSALHRTSGSYITPEALLLRIAGFAEDQDESHVVVWVGRLRKKLARQGIEIVTRTNQGYALDAKSRAIVAEALGEWQPVAAAAEAAPAARHPAGWSEAEDTIIRRGYERRATLAVIRAELRSAGHRSRSLGGISTRAAILGLTNVRAAPLWTDREDAIVRTAYEDGLTINAIRLRLAEGGFSRNRGAIQMRAIALGLSGGRNNLWTQPEREIVRAGLKANRTYAEIAEDLAARGFHRGRTAILKLARQMGVRRGERPWTDQDFATLRRLYGEKAGQRAIAAELDRTVGAVNSMASKLGILQRVRWKPEERARLVRGAAAGETFAAVCRDIERPPVNIAAEARRLNLRFAPARSRSHPQEQAA